MRLIISAIQDIKYYVIKINKRLVFGRLLQYLVVKRFLCRRIKLYFKTNSFPRNVHEHAIDVIELFSHTTYHESYCMRIMLNYIITCFSFTAVKNKHILLTRRKTTTNNQLSMSIFLKGECIKLSPTSARFGQRMQ